MYEPAVLERIEAMPDLSKEIPCSGSGHWSDPHLHGDPHQPAEWLIRQRCTACGRCVDRPVCTAFTELGRSPDRLIRCSGCHNIDTAQEFFTVLRKL